MSVPSFVVIVLIVSSPLQPLSWGYHSAGGENAPASSAGLFDASIVSAYQGIADLYPSKTAPRMTSATLRLPKIRSDATVPSEQGRAGFRSLSSAGFGHTHGTVEPGPGREAGTGTARRRRDGSRRSYRRHGRRCSTGRLQDRCRRRSPWS